MNTLSHLHSHGFCSTGKESRCLWSTENRQQAKAKAVFNVPDQRKMVAKLKPQHSRASQYFAPSWSSDHSDQGAFWQAQKRSSSPCI